MPCLHCNYYGNFDIINESDESIEAHKHYCNMHRFYCNSDNKVCSYCKKISTSFYLDKITKEIKCKNCIYKNNLVIFCDLCEYIYVTLPKNSK